MARRYGLEQGQLYLLTDNSDDGVYGFVKAGQPFILKCTPATIRAEETIRGQVAWLHYLARQGAPVCRVLPSPQGKLVEGLATEGRPYSLVCYEEVRGRRPEGADLTAALFRQWGKLLGEIHALSSVYTPELEAGPLPEWAEAARQWPQEIPADQGLVLAQYTRLIAELDALPKSRETFGLIHGDFQANNMRFDQGQVTVFDFDDCMYHWFAADIAICLYFTLGYSLPGVGL
jgi:Ser/Thr protein kinase RdoA (MazF antagonist)